MQQLVPPPHRRKWTDRKIAGKRYSCSTFMMYLGIEGKIDGLEHHTILLASDYVRNIREIEERRVLTETPSIYVQNACVTDPGLAPRGCSTLYVLVPVPHDSEHIGWSEADLPAYRARVMRRLEDIGIRDIEHRIRYEQIATPKTWAEDHQIYNGATFNLAHSLDQMLIFRPKNRFTELGGVYLVGGGTHPGSGLPVIFESSKITSRLLIEDLKLQDDLNWGAAPPVTLAEQALAYETA